MEILTVKLFELNFNPELMRNFKNVECFWIIGRANRKLWQIRYKNNNDYLFYNEMPKYCSLIVDNLESPKNNVKYRLPKPKTIYDAVNDIRRAGVELKLIDL